MEKYPVKYCRYCGEELVEVNGELTCSKYDDQLLLKMPNDKLGVITYLINLLGNKLKGKLLNEAYKASKLFFITKLFSYVLVVSIVAGTAATTVGVVNKVKNDTLLKTGEVPKEAAPIKTYEYKVALEEPELSETIEEKQEETTILENIQNTTEETVSNTIDEKQEEASDFEEQPTETTNFGNDLNQILPHYHEIIMGYISDDDFYANGPITDGAYMNATLNSRGIEDLDIGSISCNNELYLYYDNGEEGPEDDNFFAKLTFVNVDGNWKIVSDEPISMSFEEFVETHDDW